MAKATIDQVMHMKRIGKTTIEVGMRHTIAQALAALFSKNTGEQGIESIQITINPKRSKDAKPFLENLPQLMDDDVRKLVAKAEDDIFSSITDLYVVGNGGLCDSINPNPRISSNVERLIGDKMQDNQVLSQKLSEYRKPDTYEHTLPQQLLGILESRRSNARQN
jgi:hypothetical protein